LFPYTPLFRSPTRAHLDGVHDRTAGDVAERQCVPRPDLGARTGLEHIPRLHPDRGEDVALLPVGVVQEGDTSVAVGVVFDAGDLGGDAVLVAAEIDDAIPLLVAATAVPRRDAAVGVRPARGLRLGYEGRAGLGLRDVCESRGREEPATARSRRALLHHLGLRTGRSSRPGRA